VGDALTILFDAAKNVVDVIWEETPGVKHGLDETRNCTDRHVLCMRMAVPLIIWDDYQIYCEEKSSKCTHLQTLPHFLHKHISVSCESIDGQCRLIRPVIDRRRIVQSAKAIAGLDDIRRLTT